MKKKAQREKKEPKMSAKKSTLKLNVIEKPTMWLYFIKMSESLERAIAAERESVDFLHGVEVLSLYIGNDKIGRFKNVEYFYKENICESNDVIKVNNGLISPT